MAIETVRQMRDRNISTVFIASDVPLHRAHRRASSTPVARADLPANSASFRPQPQNWAAMGTVVDVIRDWIPKAEIVTWDEIRPRALVAEAAAGVFVKLMGSRAEHLISAGVGVPDGEVGVAGCASPLTSHSLTRAGGYQSSYRSHILELREQRRESLGLKDLGATFVYQVCRHDLAARLTRRRIAFSTTPGLGIDVNSCAACTSLPRAHFAWSGQRQRAEWNAPSARASTCPIRAARRRRASSRSQLAAQRCQRRADALGGLASPSVSVQAPV